MAIKNTELSELTLPLPLGIIMVTNFVILFVYFRKYLLATILFRKFELHIYISDPLMVICPLHDIFLRKYCWVSCSSGLPLSALS